ncbi:MAG: BAX inhibitor (BI)-1/YccA family protein, partial [Rhodobacteraceae bacterium]|nr:BAX inhibitor (BI)-1/YccA family protein [Paracoccaceae bacterium]
MADYQTIRAGRAGTRTLAIDEGLRAHMNKVYGLMSVGMLLTAAAAWAISGLAVTTDPSLAAAQIGADKYLTGFGAAD